jgi:hypothetical protein
MTEQILRQDSTISNKFCDSGDATDKLDRIKDKAAFLSLAVPEMLRGPLVPNKDQITGLENILVEFAEDLEEVYLALTEKV